MTGDEEQDAGLKDPALRSNLEPTARDSPQRGGVSYMKPKSRRDGGATGSGRG